MSNCLIHSTGVNKVWSLSRASLAHLAASDEAYQPPQHVILGCEVLSIISARIGSWAPVINTISKEDNKHWLELKYDWTAAAGALCNAVGTVSCCSTWNS